MSTMGWFKRIKLALLIVSSEYPPCLTNWPDLSAFSSLLVFSFTTRRHGTCFSFDLVTTEHICMHVFFQQMQNRMQTAQDAQAGLQKQLDSLKHEIEAEKQARLDSVR